MRAVYFLFALTTLMIGCKSSAISPVSADSVQETSTNVRADDAAVTNNEISDDSAGVFSNITGKEWKLIDIHFINNNINFDRDTLTKEGIGDIFTLNFDAGMVSGKGEPNRYSAPYSLGDRQAISIMPMRSTLMASIFPNEKLNEYDFFMLLNNVYEWRLTDKKLELFSKDADGSNVRLAWTASD
ncbi:MAG: META domain-containing protein [Treponema sp.]|nr:META domain-containing protein [Treponema sp.]